MKEAEQQVEEETNPRPKQTTAADVHRERVEAAEDIDQNAMDLEKMSFGSRDLKNFSNMVQQNADKKYEKREGIEDQKVQKAVTEK